MNLSDYAQRYADYQIKMRRYFHENPEISGREFNTSKTIKEELDKAGIPWKACGMQTGVLATVEGAKPGKTIMLRGDMDALSVTEETGLSFASKNEGVMHACGHDCHTSMLLTAAKILNDMKAELRGTVKFAFQPAEELGQGARAMIEDGVLEGVDACFGMHVWGHMASGTYKCVPGPMMAAGDKFTIDIKGKGGHGAEPHNCIDAVVAASAVVQSLQTIASRTVIPIEPVVVTVGELKAGSRWNVVAENAHLEGTTRCFSHEVYEALPKYMEDIVTKTASVYGATATLDYEKVLKPTINDEYMANLAAAAAEKVLGAGTLNKQPPTMGAEDMSEYILAVPGAMMLVGIENEACNAIYGNHHSKFTVDEDVLLKGAMIYAQVAIDYTSEN